MIPAQASTGLIASEFLFRSGTVLSWLLQFRSRRLLRELSLAMYNGGMSQTLHRCIHIDFVFVCVLIFNTPQEVPLSGLHAIPSTL